MMFVNPAAGGLTGYVKPGENADVTQPWVMWAGSPYEHLMIPPEWVRLFFKLLCPKSTALVAGTRSSGQMAAGL